MNYQTPVDQGDFFFGVLDLKPETTSINNSPKLNPCCVVIHLHHMYDWYDHSQ